ATAIGSTSTRLGTSVAGARRARFELARRDLALGDAGPYARGAAGDLRVSARGGRGEPVREPWRIATSTDALPTQTPRRTRTPQTQHRAAEILGRGGLNHVQLGSRSFWGAPVASVSLGGLAMTLRVDFARWNQGADDLRIAALTAPHP